ncbi:MAG: hypothetical protein ACE5I7_10335 [Candidatus Binatia bacterium]
MTDRSFGLFEPDALVPAQFYAAFRGGSAVRGEKRLMLAVLQDALDCYQKYAFARDGHGRQLFADADDWIGCEDRDWYFSFENICEILEINPAYLRLGVQRWRQQALRSRSSARATPVPAGDSRLLAVG